MSEATPATPLILVVDDNDAARYVKSRVLTLAGFRTVQAADGGSGLRMAREQRPALVLLDVKLPDRNGLEVCRELKSDPRTAHIIVLQTSAAMVDTQHRVNALDAGADSYMVEPIEADELIANVRALLRLQRAEGALRESEERFRQFADSVNDAFWVFSPTEDRFLYLSPAHRRLFGGPVDAMYAYKRARLAAVHPDDRERVQQRFDALVSTGMYEEEYRVLQPDGSERWIAERAFPVLDAEGRPYRYAGIAQDATLRKQAELMLLQADRQKDEFLAMLAHELRSPMAPMRSAADYLRTSGTCREGGSQQAVAIIGRQLEHLARLVDDLLDVSRISQGKINLRLVPVTLQQVLATAIERVRLQVDGKRQRLHAALPDEPVWLYGDPVRLAQVFGNLLHNASKFTPEGGRLDVGVQLGGGSVSVTVRDNGIGIRPELLPRVFDLFTQDEMSLDRSQGGMGIGLSLVRRLVELHEGTVAVESEGVGRGSCFTVRLRRHPAPADQAAAAAAVPAAGSSHQRRVLVVDDNADAAEAMQMLLSAAGHQVQLASDGQEALRRATAEPPEVVLLDIGLPGLDGYEVARALRNDPGTRAAHLVAVTGYGGELDKQRAMAAGFNHHLTKPVDFDHLLSLLAEAPAA